MHSTKKPKSQSGRNCNIHLVHPASHSLSNSPSSAGPNEGINGRCSTFRELSTKKWGISTPKQTIQTTQHVLALKLYLLFVEAEIPKNNNDQMRYIYKHILSSSVIGACGNTAFLNLVRS